MKTIGILGILFSMWWLATHHPFAAKATYNGPQCTLVYPRGFEFADHGPKDGPECGDIAAGWGACVPTWEI